MVNPAFEEEWPEELHPLGYLFLHPPSDEYGSPGLTFEKEQIDALGKHLENIFGMQLLSQVPQPSKHTLTINVALGPDSHPVGEPYEYIIEGVDRTAVRIPPGSLPPGLSLVGDRITGTPTQSGIWDVAIHVGPLVHYQRPLNEGPIGPFNPGRWVDIDKPLETPEPTVELPSIKKAARDAIRAKLDQLDAEEAAAESEDTE